MNEETIFRLLQTLVVGSLGAFFGFVGIWDREDLVSRNERRPRIFEWFGWEFARVVYVVLGSLLLFLAAYHFTPIWW